MNANDAIKLLLREKPQFHGADAAPTSWESQREVLDFIGAKLAPGMASLETGCGYSTVAFAASGSSHTTVTPAQRETERVAEFCASHAIPTDKLHFAIGKSQDVLPTLTDKGPLDMVYVDGAHRFPFPCLDWVFTEDRLNIGGFMLVDDVRIPTCRMLHDFLAKEPNWTFDRFIGDTSVYLKTAATDYSVDWRLQGYNASFPDWSFLPPRGLKARLRALLGR